MLFVSPLCRRVANDGVPSYNIIMSCSVANVLVAAEEEEKKKN